MQLIEAKEILNKNGYLLEDKYMDDLDTELDDITNSTVDYIDKNNYKDYIGKFINVKGNVKLDNLNLTKLPIRFGVVGGHFYCYYNKLKSLEGAPIEVKGNFICDNNKLTSLKGSPKKVKGCFACSDNQLASLEGAPVEVGRYFDCQNNQLTSLEGAPKIVGENFYCCNNPLTSLKGAPKFVGKNFWAGENKVEFTEDDVLEVSSVEGDIYP